jgi:hypothetical protein
MTKSEKAIGILFGAIVIGALAQSVAKHQAVLLGLSGLELALVSGFVGAIVTRKLA